MGFGDHYPKLLVQLPDKSERRGFVLFDVAARKVPDVRIPTATGRTVAKEDLVSIDEKTSHDLMDVNGLPLTHAMPVSHFGDPRPGERGQCESCESRG